ncbi:MAG: flagellar basal body L-ring protein FlgH [Deltaproteobacteria bacterium]|nr:flagellar basal body L-ring protein FlgH [Candidatus Anaeroferrophillus wilburensis]MBN2889605.1 flagellar basal body L-ring protein FlgH [Deltaproteobacteria bacterium]
MKNFQLLSVAVLVAVFVLLTACGGSRQQVMSPPAPISAPHSGMAQPLLPLHYQNGSLYQTDGQSGALFYDSRRARVVGDIVFVIIAENFQGTGKASTQSDGSNSSSYAIPELMGYKNIFKSIAPNADMGNLIETERTTKTKGNGSTSRSNTLSARVAARVMDVLPNGNLKIQGSHFTQVNGEDHFITVSGVIRASDIAVDNTISSLVIADATINYGGYGDLGTKQRVGWATKVLDVVWPF